MHIWLEAADFTNEVVYDTTRPTTYDDVSCELTFYYEYRPASFSY